MPVKLSWNSPADIKISDKMNVGDFNTDSDESGERHKEDVVESPCKR
jgi:hypothetical protein